MREQLEEMLEHFETGASARIEPSSAMFEFNDFMAARGYSVSWPKVVRLAVLDGRNGDAYRWNPPSAEGVQRARYPAQPLTVSPLRVLARHRLALHGA